MHAYRSAYNAYGTSTLVIHSENWCRWLLQILLRDILRFTDDAAARTAALADATDLTRDSQLEGNPQAEEPSRGMRMRTSKQT